MEGTHNSRKLHQYDSRNGVWWEVNKGGGLSSPLWFDTKGGSAVGIKHITTTSSLTLYLPWGPPWKSRVSSLSTTASIINAYGLGYWWLFTNMIRGDGKKGNESFGQPASAASCRVQQQQQQQLEIPMFMNAEHMILLATFPLRPSHHHPAPPR